MSNNEIKIKITEQFEETRSTAKRLTNDIAKAGGFEGQHGAARKASVESSLAGIDAIFEKGSVSLQDIKQLSEFFKTLYEALGKAAANTSQMSEEMKKLIDTQIKTIDKLDKKREEQIALLSQGKFDKATNKFTSTKETQNIMRDIGAFKVTKSGEASKRGEVDIVNIQKQMEAGIKYVDKQGNDLSQNPVFQEQIQKIEELNNKYSNTQRAIDRYENALNNLTKKMEDQAKADSGKVKSNSLPAETTKAYINTNKLLGSAEQEIAQTKNQQDFTTAVEGSVGALKKQDGMLKRAFKQFSVYNLIIKNARNALNSAVSTIKDIDKYLTEQAMVTGRTRKEVFGLVKSYQSLAKQYNATTKEVAEVNTEFMRQGKTMEESMQLTEATLASARVAGISGAESVNYLTTALNGFQMAAEDAMRVSDKFAAVAAASATSYEEIATALSKVASQANMAGMSIDYTTALLSKGIETTKEAPETIGTALKTVIARMRELTDYGETLSGDTDINNVETQLAYVGIELKNANGELRSTEDVLDELGRKWDTLSSNQQAAVAKALAGTRQQSRLIAMMSDYERVIELQIIAQRSQGSTMAQMSALMTGLEASLNKIKIAWESIITNVVDNDFIVAITNMFGEILSFVEWISDHTVGLVLIYGSLVTLGISMLGNFAARVELQREEQRLNLLDEKSKKEALLQEVRKNKEKAEGLKTSIREQISALEEHKIKLKTLQTEQRQTLEDLKQSGASADKIAAQEKLVNETSKQLIITNKEIALKKEEYAKVQEISTLYKTQENVLEQQLSLLKDKLGVLSQWTTGLTNVLNIFKGLKSAGKSLYKTLLPIMTNPWALAAVAVIGTVAAVGYALYKASKVYEEATARVGELSAEIYNLNEQTNAINSITSQYEDLDRQIIKTKEDQEQMNKLLDEAAEKLDEDQQKEYNALGDNASKLEYLKGVKEKNKQKVKQKQQEILNNININPDVMLKEASNRAAVLSINNMTAGDIIDSMTNLDASDRLALEEFSQNLMSMLDPQTLLKYANDTSGQMVKEFVDGIKNASTIIDGEEVSIYNILNSEDYSWSDQVKAYEEALSTMTGDTRVAFEEMYKTTYGTLSQVSKNTLAYFDKIGMSADQINELYKSYDKIKTSDVFKDKNIENIFGGEEEYKKKISDVYEMIETEGVDLRTAITSTFKDELAQLGVDADKATSLFINIFGKPMETGILNMGQNVEKFQSKVASVYEKASQWNSLKESEKAAFIQDNAGLFEGKDGAALLTAFEEGDYDKIQAALEESKILNKERQELLDDIEAELMVEESKNPDEQNLAYIKQLKEQREQLLNDGYEASLELQKKQQDAQLDAYKDYLQKEKDALTKSLEEKKSAYEKYFSAINQSAEDEDYEEKAELLVNNISKLTGSNAATENKRADLEKQLEQLEKERLETLRQRGQEQIIANIDDEISEISDKFDKLLDSNQQMLIALSKDMENPEKLIANMISKEVSNGATAVDLNSFLNDLKGDFGALTDLDFGDIEVKEDENNNLILNVNGTTYNLSTEEEGNLFTVIMNALKQIGMK